MFNFLKAKKIIVTHDGSFHADDVFACATLGLYLKKNNIPYRIVRTRDEALISRADYVIDVGGKYNHTIHHYDHHQSDGAGVRSNDIPYAAFGLIWKHYGVSLCGGDDEISMDIDRRIVQPIDASDNGLDLCSSYTYGVSPITIQNVLHWISCKTENNDLSFKKVTRWAQKILTNVIHEKTKDYETMKRIVSEFSQQQGSSVVTLTQDGYNRQIIWQALLPREEAKDLLFVVYKNSDNKKWNVLAMRKEACSFENRKSLPQAWAGKRGQEFADMTGVSDAIFCHHSLFLAAAGSQLGAEKLANIAVSTY